MSNPHILGHRGWRTRFPDNTEAGIGAGVDAVGAVEIDVRRTRDGRLVLAHDPEMAGLVVCETSWEDLRSLDLGGGHRPALLDDVIAGFPEAMFDLEVKNWPNQPGFEPDHRIALDVATRARPVDVVTCFYWPSMDAVRRSRPDTNTGLLVDAPGSAHDAVSHASRSGHAWVAPSLELLLGDPGVIGEAQSSGLKVAVWTVNDPGAARELAAAGVDAIITDDPGIISDAVRS